MKKKILFVDDEPSILKGIERAFDEMFPVWDMRFAQGGREALAVLEKEPFDVVVSDMRMPGFDGEKLLLEIKRNYPKIVRIILTGSTEKTRIFNTLNVAHQYLAKPCDFKVLESALNRIFAVHDILEDDRLKEIMSAVDTLPSIPDIYTRLLEELKSENASIKKLGEIISQDIGLTTRILRLINSPYFGISRYIDSVEEAIKLLGIDMIKALAFTFQVFVKYEGINLPGFSIKELYRHSLETASIAKSIAEQEGLEKTMVIDSFLAGMLHDIGKLFLAAHFPPKYEKVLTLIREENRDVQDAEMEVFGTTHSEVGAYLMGIWGMNNQVTEAIIFHHHPADCPCRDFIPLTAVCAGNILECRMNSDSRDNSEYIFDQEYFSRFHFNISEKITLWSENCVKTAEEVSHAEK